MKIDLSIRSRRILLPNGFMEGVVNIADGKIVSIVSGDKLEGELNFDAGRDVVMPGIIDAHVHINEPGRTDWEGFATGTYSAAAGGVTTIIDMPLNSKPVTTNFPSLILKIDSARNFTHVNVGFYGGVVPGNLFELEKLLQGGVFGLKAFLTHSGIEDFPETSPADLHDVLLLLKKYDRPLLVHCELSAEHEGIKYLHEHPLSYQAFLNSRPRSWEDNAIEAMIKLCRASGAHVHIVHLSSSDSLKQISDARAEGLNLTVETAPHYLFFASEEIEEGETLLKCAPPIRERSNNEKLIRALRDGIIDFIASDHSPAPPEMKETGTGNFERAWGGIAGMQFSLPSVWTTGKRMSMTLHEFSKWMCENPAKFLRLEKSKGKIAVGFDADIVIWNPEKEFSLRGDQIYHRHKTTPYSGKRLMGEVQYTIVNGHVAYDKNRFTEENYGQILFFENDKK